MEREVDGTIQKKVNLLDIEKGVENDEFLVYLQPQINVTNGNIDSFEALIRWNHPERGILNPDSFLPMAKEYSLISEIDYIVFEKACCFLKSRMEDQKELFRISCNFVREHFVKEDFPDILIEICRRTGVPAKYLSVEITEGSAFKEEQKVQAAVSRLKAYGFHVYLDDYGADASTFSDLMIHSISHVKLDKKITDSIERRNVQVVVQGLCEIAHRLSYTVVCEGVETERQLELVKKCGVDIIQGFYYYKPMNLEQAGMLYDEQSRK